MKGTSKPRLPHLRPDQPHLRLRGCLLSENAAMPPGQQVKVHKSASFVDILEVCKFTTLCDRKGYAHARGCSGASEERLVRIQFNLKVAH